ncbi:MAG: recombinase family protein [Hydrogeniiclostridium mannosilyticum]
MKAAIYCRLSKEDEDLEKENRGKESESIQNQKSMLIDYALEKGYEIYHIYSDEDYSGIDRNRPDFNRMIEAASQKKFDIILAKTQSRFTRDMELVEKYLHGKFIEWGIRFIAVVDHVDTADEYNKKSRQINGLVNEWYLEDLSNNVRSVLTHKRREGKYIGTFALYGYKKDPKDKNHLIIDSEAAEIVKYIFALYLAGNGASRIARLLNEENISSPTRYKREHGINYKQSVRCQNEDLWSKATIYRMLTNQTYIGNLEQGRHKKVSYKSPKTVWVPIKDWIIVPGTHEPIVDYESFECLQKMLQDRVRGGGDGKINPLAGKVFCGICGSSMEQTGSGYVNKKTGKSLKYFRCRMSQRDKKRCPGQEYMPMEQLQAIVLERIRHHISGYLALEKPDKDLMDLRTENKQRAKQSELERLRNEIQRRRKAMQELYLDKSSGIVESAQFVELNQTF